MLVGKHNAADFMFDSKLIEPNHNHNVITGSAYIENNYSDLLKYSAAVLTRYTDENIDYKKYDLLNSVYEAIKQKEEDGWYADSDDGTAFIVKDYIFKSAKSPNYYNIQEDDIDELPVSKGLTEIDRFHKISDLLYEMESIIKSEITDGNKRLIITAVLKPEEILSNEAALYFIRKFNEDETRYLTRALKSKSGLNLSEKERSKFKAWII